MTQNRFHGFTRFISQLQQKKTAILSCFNSELWLMLECGSWKLASMAMAWKLILFFILKSKMSFQWSDYAIWIATIVRFLFIQSCGAWDLYTFGVARATTTLKSATPMHASAFPLSREGSFVTLRGSTVSFGGQFFGKKSLPSAWDGIMLGMHAFC